MSVKDIQYTKGRCREVVNVVASQVNCGNLYITRAIQSNLELHKDFQHLYISWLGKF